MGSVDILAGCLHFHFFIMHPSSFYDLRARYIYTPLYGPYSLSEALEGLLFYSLNESRDFILIGSKISLRHELISEISNVVDDLQDYLAYFSSTFLISPPDSLDLIKELRTNFDGFKYPIVCWGALITHLVTARKIVESNFWPHFFQPSINNLPASLRKPNQRPPFALPNTPWNKLPVSTSAFILTSHSNGTHHSPYRPLESRRLLVNKQSEHPQSMPSKTGPMVGKEDCPMSLRLNTTPTRSASHSAQISPSRQRSVAPFNLHCPRSYKSSSNEVFPLPNRLCTAQRSCGSIPAHTDDARDSGDLKYNPKVVGMDEQVGRETEVAGEGEEVTGVPCACLPTIQLASSQGDASKGLVTRPARTSSSSSSSRPTSSAAYIPYPTPNLHQGPTTLLPHSISLPQTFANPIPQPSMRFSPKGRHPQHYVSSIPIPSFSAIQRQLLEAQTQHFGPRSPTTPPFQCQSSPNLSASYSTYDPLNVPRQSFNV